MDDELSMYGLHTLIPVQPTWNAPTAAVAACLARLVLLSVEDLPLASMFWTICETSALQSGLNWYFASTRPPLYSKL